MSSMQLMSSQLSTVVPVFDRSNYQLWAKAMKAYLMSQGLYGHVSGTVIEPPYPYKVDEDGKTLTPTKEELKAYHEEHDPWQHTQDMALVSILLCLLSSVQQNASEVDNAQQLWETLKLVYDMQSAPTIYKDFKEAISFHINSNSHPGLQFDKFNVAIARLQNITYKADGRDCTLRIPDLLVALIALAAILHKWEMLVPIITNNMAIGDLSMLEIRDAIIVQYKTETNKGQHKQATNPANANRLSAVKRKCGNPCFSQQEHSQQPQAGPSNPNQQQSHRQCGSRCNAGRGGKASGKGKGKAHGGHSHVASVAAFAAPVFTTDAALPSPSSSTIAHFGASSSMMMWTITQSPSTSWVDGVYPSVNKALSLLECMKVTPTIQRTKKLEERFLQLDEEVHARVGFYEDDYSSDEDMSQTVPGHEIFAFAPSDLADILGESMALDFEYLSVNDDGVIFDPSSSDKENHALTPPHISPQSVVTDLGHSNPEAEAEAARLAVEEAEIAAEWATKNTYPLLNCQSSNERIEEAQQKNQNFINRTPTPGLPADFDDGLEEALDWGSSDEEKYAFSSFSTLDANSMTVLDPLSSKGSKGSCNYMSDLAEVCKMYNVNFGVLDVLKCEHKISFHCGHFAILSHLLC